MDDYLALTPVAGRAHCNLEGLSVEFSRDGVAQHAEWPRDVVLEMDPKFPKNDELADTHKCLGGGPVVSTRFKQLLEAQGVTNVEFLPVAIRDHAGTIASAEYFILNPLLALDVIDLAASDLVFRDDTKEHVVGAALLVIREADVPASALCFRLARYPITILVHRSIAEAIRAAGLTGIKLKKVADVD